MIRYTLGRKAEIVLAIRAKKISREQAMREHGLSDDELATWERNFDCYGVNDPRSTRLQHYRGNTAKHLRAHNGLSPRAADRSKTLLVSSSRAVSHRSVQLSAAAPP